MPDKIELSVIVPLLNEEESVLPLVDGVQRALARRGAWELLLIDDGSEDATPEIAARLARSDPHVQLIRLSRNYGQTAAIQAGFDHARGDVVVTMDGDLQNDPQDIPRLLDRLDEGYDLVAGYRVKRKDRLLTRKVPSWIANRLIAWITGVSIQDNGCSLKAYRRTLLRRLNLYSDMHRFIPAVAVAMGGARISEIPVRHHPRKYGVSKYGLSRIGKVAADLLTIKMIRSFREQPLAMFCLGAAGAGILAIAFSVATGMAMTFQPSKAVAVVFPGAALLWFGLAFYLVMLGLIAEVALHEIRADAPGTDDLPVFREEAG